MPIIKKMALVPYSHEAMFRLVDDVEAYPAFVPWCTKGEVFSRTVDEVRASLTFAKGALQKSFSTINRLRPHKMIEIRLLNGPFKRLEGFWEFEAITDRQSKISLFLEFEFSSGFLASFFEPLFHQVANRLVDAFCLRAEIIYGKQA